MNSVASWGEFQENESDATTPLRTWTSPESRGVLESVLPVASCYVSILCLWGVRAGT